jgi:hypothetical protein
MGIVRFALRWPYTFYLLALLILFLGVTAFRSMPADIFRRSTSRSSASYGNIPVSPHRRWSSASPPTASMR